MDRRFHRHRAADDHDDPPAFDLETRQQTCNARRACAFRDLPFVLRNQPSFIPFQTLPQDAKTRNELFFALAMDDIRAGCDLMRPAWERTHGDDGFDSLEVDPTLAYDREATFAVERMSKPMVAPPSKGSGTLRPPTQKSTLVGFQVPKPGGAVSLHRRLGWLAAAAGYDDGERFWEQLVEHLVDIVTEPPGPRKGDACKRGQDCDGDGFEIGV